MGVKAHIRETLKSLLNRYGYKIMPSNQLYEWQRDPQTQASYKRSDLPDGAAEYLSGSSERLKELQARYSDFGGEVTKSLQWTDDYVSPDEMVYFRGDNAYVWQLRGQNMNPMAYVLTMYYVKSIDTLGLLDTLKEDDCFGNYTFTIDETIVSRDLLDSIIEIYFLEKHLNVSKAENLTVLDVGAGYGRLAHRMSCALPNLTEYLCTDAFPISTFVSEYYLRFREQSDKAKVVPLDEIEGLLDGRSVDVAVNIHSFSECRMPAIDWWLSTLAKYEVKHLMIVPNTLDALRCDDGTEYTHLLEKNGYTLKAKEPKYSDPLVQQYGMGPAYHYLFERR